MKELRLDFSDMSGGKNSAYPQHALSENQVANTLNVLHEPIGISRAPGYSGIVPSGHASYNYRHPGFMKYIKDDGTEIIIVVDNQGSICTFNPENGVYTEIGTCTASSNAWNYVNAVGKMWLCNGIDFLKIENDLSVYNVSLPSPTTGYILTNPTGGTFAAGTYNIYIAYARVDGDGRYLYSYPYYLGSQALAVDNGQLGVYHYASSDPQVEKIVVFMTDADGSIVYYYGEESSAEGAYYIDENDRDETLLMTTVSSSNVPLPISPDSIFYYDNKLYIWEYGTKKFYWSLSSDVSAFELERFVSENFRLLPYSLSSMFNIGSDLFFNSIGIGITISYYGDMSSVFKHIQRNFWFINCKTGEGKTNTVSYKGIVFGLTNDGFRFFDGETFSDDLSFHIKPDIDKIYNNLSNEPSAIIYRRPGKRTEYRFSYENINYGSTGNNDQLIFNLDFYFDIFSSKKTWEVWENGFDSMVIVGGVWYGCQSGLSASYIVKESGVSDINCYNKSRNFVSENFLKKAYVLTRTFISDLDVICRWGSIYGLATSSGDITGNIIVFDAGNSKYSFSLEGVTGDEAVLPSAASGLGLALPFVMGPVTPSNTLEPMPFNAIGNTVAIEISQIANDLDFFIYKIQLPRVKIERNNLT